MLRYEADESSDEELVCEYTHVTLQLLDLMHVLLTRALGVQTAWARQPGELWEVAWCPALQGMARLCCDSRQQVRTQSLTLLQRSLLLPDLQVLSPSQWEFAFLTTHLKIHSGEKSYKCNLCDYAAARAGHLRGHLRKKHISGYS